MLYNGEENHSFVLSNPLIAKESDLRHAFCTGGAADADLGVRGQGWSTDPGPPGLYPGSSSGQGAPSSDLVPCQAQITTCSLCWLGSQQGGETCAELRHSSTVLEAEVFLPPTLLSGGS